jgi:hypothetical protein
MLLLFTDELIKFFLVHIVHQLIKNLGIIQGHILQELGKLINWNRDHISRLAWDFDKLDWLRPIHVSAHATVLVAEPTFITHTVGVVL